MLIMVVGDTPGNTFMAFADIIGSIRQSQPSEQKNKYSVIKPSVG